MQKETFGTWQFGKIGVWVNFIIQKSKSKHLPCLSFLRWQTMTVVKHVFVHTYLLSTLVFAKYKTNRHKGEKRQGKYRYLGTFQLHCLV